MAAFAVTFGKVDLPKCNIRPGKTLWTANFFRGPCPTDCVYCYARDMRINMIHARDPQAADPGSVALLENTLWPDFLFLSSYSEPFLPAVLPATRAVVRMGFRKGSFISFSTKRRPDDELLGLLGEHRRSTSVSISLSSMRGERNQVLEPGAPSAEDRLAFASDLVKRGVSVWVKADTLFADLDDAPDAIQVLLRAVAEAGVSKMLFSYAFYRRPSRKRVAQALLRLGRSLDSMSEEQDIASSKGFSLPLHQKGERLRRIGAMARAAGIRRVITCGCKNDLDPETIGFDSRICEFHWE